MVSFIKKAQDLKPKASVKFLLHQHLSDWDAARSLKNMHASELTKEGGLCPRMYALADVTKFKGKDRYLTASERMTFQIGRDQERNIVLWFAEMGKAICHWKCVACGTKHEFQLKPSACKTCGTKKLDPEEVRFTSALNGASAGVDMLLALGKKKLTPVEIKTMDKEQFKDLKAPLAEHKWRSNLYLRIIAESTHNWSNMVSSEEIHVLYTTKGGYGCADPEPAKWGMYDKFSPFKEYVVGRNDADTDNLALRAQTVHDFRRGTVGMPSGLCSTALDKRALKCPLKGVCFGGDHPPQHVWNP